MTGLDRDGVLSLFRIAISASIHHLLNEPKTLCSTVSMIATIAYNSGLSHEEIQGAMMEIQKEMEEVGINMIIHHLGPIKKEGNVQ